MPPWPPGTDGTKAGIAWTTGGAAVGRRVLRGYAIGMGIGALAAFAVMFL